VSEAAKITIAKEVTDDHGWRFEPDLPGFLTVRIPIPADMRLEVTLDGIFFRRLASA
jgi:hypothetical protein